jgi:hypothetical protein
MADILMLKCFCSTLGKKTLSRAPRRLPTRGNPTSPASPAPPSYSPLLPQAGATERCPRGAIAGPAAAAPSTTQRWELGLGGRPWRRCTETGGAPAKSGWWWGDGAAAWRRGSQGFGLGQRMPTGPDLGPLGPI